MIHLQGKILSEDGRIEYTDMCEIGVDTKEVDGVLAWFGWIVLPPDKPSILKDGDYLLSLEGGTRRMITLRDRFAAPALFDGIGAPP
jgi:hypothetical protein